MKNKIFINLLMRLLILTLMPSLTWAAQCTAGNVAVNVHNIGSKVSIEFAPTNDPNWIPAAGTWLKAPAGPDNPIKPQQKGTAEFAWTADEACKYSTFGQAFTTKNGGMIYLVVNTTGDKPSTLSVNPTGCKCSGKNQSYEISKSKVTINLNCD